MSVAEVTSHPMKQKILYILLLFCTKFVAQNCRLHVSGFIKDNTDTIYGVKHTKVLLKTDNGLEMVVLSDTNGYYSFCFAKCNFKKFTVTIETSKHTVSFVNPRLGYLASKDMQAYTLNDTAKFEHLKRNFKVVPVLACGFTFPPFCFKLNSVTLDTLPLPTGPGYSKYDSMVVFPKEGIKIMVEYFKDHPKEVLQISGHADLNEVDPLSLSQLRAEALNNELVKAGINEKHFVTKGYGSTRPLVQENEIKKARSKKQKEELHTKNRRCVFGIVSWDYLEKK